MQSEEIKTSLEEKCPYCKSKSVVSTGIAHGVGTSDGYNVPKREMKCRYKCLDCNEQFYVVKCE